MIRNLLIPAVFFTRPERINVQEADYSERFRDYLVRALVANALLLDGVSLIVISLDVENRLLADIVALCTATVAYVEIVVAYRI